MTRLNFVIICCVSLGSLLCYQRVEHNPYGRYFAEALDTIHTQGLEKLDRQPLFDAAVSGMTGLLDEHTSFISRKHRQAYQSELDQHFTGVGIEVHYDREKKRVAVANSIVGSPHPAHDAGLRSGDQILAIDGQPVVGKSLEEVEKLIKGPKDQAVEIRVLHDGAKEPVTLNVVRREILVDAVAGDVRNDEGSWDYLLPTKPPIVYVRIRSFGEGTSSQLRSVLDRLKKNGQLQALIVDVRDDPGGYLDEADQVCDLFIPGGVIVTTRGRKDELTGKQEIEVRRASGRGKFLDVPMVVLINHDSASASEIFAACMQDHQRAAVIGSRSYGKGSVQKMYSMEMDQSILKLTTASYWRPSGKNIHRLKTAKETDEWGVRPDAGQDVPLTDKEEAKRQDQRQERDAFHTGAAAAPRGPLDPQLARAVEYLQAKLAGKELPAAVTDAKPPEKAAVPAAGGSTTGSGAESK